MKSHYATVLVTALLAFLAHANDKPPKNAETVTNTVRMKLKLIKAGTFQMGSPASEEGKYGTAPQAQSGVRKKRVRPALSAYSSG